ncbi:hypothetical protein N431DRAFT_553216 [Stipitochalara longipes BDJ]|nr:hypothetical protein N431DRAFT_553216 [Stipitochalara longipes BDJ]
MAAITTTFTGPPACAQSVGGLTMLQDEAYFIWLNAPVPVPGVTISSCYPPQFMSSFLAQQAGSSPPAFSSLVCPSGYATQAKYANNYIACCPSGWDGLALDANAPADRPASGATCYTNIYNVPITITSYDATAVQATSIFLPSHVSDQAYAYPYEGFAYQGAVSVAGGGGEVATTAKNTGGNGGGATNTKGNGGATSTMASGAVRTSDTKGGDTTSGTDAAQAANTGSATGTGLGSGDTGVGGKSPSNTAGGSGGTVNGVGTDVRSTSTVTTISSPGAAAVAEKMSPGVMAAIVVGGILALLFLIAIGLFALSYRQRRTAENKGPVQIDVYNSHYHSHYWWLAPLMNARSRRQPRDRESGAIVGGTRWPGFRGKNAGDQKMYHELDGQKDGHDRKNATELQGSNVNKPQTYEMEARIAKFDGPDVGH